MAYKAFSTIRSAGWAQPERWVAQGTSGPAWVAPPHESGTPETLNPALPDMSVVVVDPLGWSYPGNATVADTVPPAAASAAGCPVIPRLTLAMNADPNGPTLAPIPFVLAEKQFLGMDDLLFSRDGEKRPQALPGPQAQAGGSFSFGFMVRRRTMTQGAGAIIFEPTLPLITTMIFKKRDLQLVGAGVSNPPPERALLADVSTTLPSGNLRLTLRGPAGWEATKRLQPVLLSTRIADSMAPGGSRVFCQWYVVKGGEGTDIVVEGSDWPAMSVGWQDADPTTPAPTIFVALFDALAAVQEAEIPLR